jgi:RNA polymerase sigma factor (sigma-70 family)
MGESDAFRTLIARVRTGDARAAEELVARYEPTIRRVARVRLVDPRLRRQLDTMDICQSVLGSFFVRAALGQYDLDEPDQLLRLLATMTRNKLAAQAQKQRAARRDHRRIEAGGLDADEIAGREGSPSRHVAARELLDEAHRRLAPDERQLLDLREQGREWADIADELRATPEALRKKLSRAIDRVAGELGLDESDGP